MNGFELGAAVSRLRRLRVAWGPGSVERNTAIASTRTIVRTIVGILLLPILLDRIGTAPTGLFVFATTLTAYFTAVEFGLVTGTTKYVAEYKATQAAEKLNSALRGSLLLMIGIGGLAALVLAAVGVFAGADLFRGSSVKSQAEATLLVAAATAIVYWPSRLGTAALEGLERYDLSATIQIGSSLVTLGAIAWLVTVTHSVAVLVAVFGALVTLEGVVGGLIALPHLGLRRRVGAWRGTQLRSVVGLGSGLFVIGITDTLVYSLDRTIVAAFVGGGAIVAYEVGLRLHNGVRACAALAGGALVAPMARLSAHDRVARLRALVLIGSFIGVLITTPLAVLVMVLAKPFVHAWLGSGFTRYAVYAQIFVSYWLLHGNTGVLSSAVTGIGRLRVFVWLAVIGGVITLALSVALTAAWGTVGVIWGTVIPGWLGVPVSMYFLLRHVGIPVRDYMQHVFVPAYTLLAAWSAVVVAAKLLLEPAGWVGVLAFGAIALGVLWGLAYRPLRTRWLRALATV